MRLALAAALAASALAHRHGDRYMLHAWQAQADFQSCLSIPGRRWACAYRVPVDIAVELEGQEVSTEGFVSVTLIIDRRGRVRRELVRLP